MHLLGYLLLHLTTSKLDCNILENQIIIIEAHSIIQSEFHLNTSRIRCKEQGDQSRFKIIFKYQVLKTKSIKSHS